MNKFIANTNKENLYKDYLLTINNVLHLTERQIDVLALLMYIDDNHDKFTVKTKDIISTECRRYICNKLGILNCNLSAYIKSFKKKCIIQSYKRSNFVKKDLMPLLIKDRLQITIIMKIDA